MDPIPIGLAHTHHMVLKMKCPLDFLKKSVSVEKEKENKKKDEDLFFAVAKGRPDA
jgi:hypothetical protein